ncbi:MAG: hypothetical protein J5801_07055 [Bacteroidales bacterium]|nr:hypothetical protein [Bacteroidales bacterium]
MKNSGIDKVIVLLLLIVSAATVALSNDNFMTANVHFYLLLGIAAIDIVANRSFSLLTVWLAGFIYIILSDILLYHYQASDNWVDSFVLLANDAVLAGYYFLRPQQKNTLTITNEHHEVPSQFAFVSVLVVLYVFYLYNLVPNAIQSFLVGGRKVEDVSDNVLFTTFLGGYHILPLVIAFYIVRIRHKSAWLALLYSLPIFAIDFFSGDRFRFIFSVMPFFLVSSILRIDNLNFKRMITIVIALIVIVVSADYMLHTRRTGFGKYEKTVSTDVKHPHDDSFSVKVSSQCSPEGTIRMMNILHNHLQTHEPTYGLSTGFVLYFWIPRVVWPSKPTMLNHWLPRMYMNVGEGHSTSSGFMGEPYADFEYFAFIVYFLIGVLLSRGNNLLIKYDYGRAPVYNSLYVSLLIPYAFFVVRSPVTGTCYILMQWLMLYLFKKVLFVKKIN